MRVVGGRRRSEVALLDVEVGRIFPVMKMVGTAMKTLERMMDSLVIC